MEVLGFGRLQFQPMYAYDDLEGDGFKVEKDKTFYLNVHIPRTTTPLDYDECELSFNKGVEFFKNKNFNGGKVLFHCKSWLLFPKHYEMLKPTSNIIKFMNRFSIIKNDLYPDYSQLWRLFDMYYNGNPYDFPDNSTLRHKYIKLLQVSGKTGWGEGVFFKD